MHRVNWLSWVDLRAHSIHVDLSLILHITQLVGPLFMFIFSIFLHFFPVCEKIVKRRKSYLRTLLSRNVWAYLFLNFRRNTFTILLWHLLALLSWHIWALLTLDWSALGSLLLDWNGLAILFGHLLAILARDLKTKISDWDLMWIYYFIMIL